MNADQADDHRSQDKNPGETTYSPGVKALGLLAIVSAIIYSAILYLSPAFRYGEPEIDRPIREVILLFAAAFVLYVIACFVAANARQSFSLTLVIVATAVLFRFAFTFSPPIQEVDIHRYVWDGIVATQGVSPFRYSPETVFTSMPAPNPAPNSAQNPAPNPAPNPASIQNPIQDIELQKLAAAVEKDPASKEVLNRLQSHFGYLPTVYPTTSQAVFRFSAAITPDGVPLDTRIWILKLILVCFDLGTLFLVFKLLQECELPVGLSVIYAWCPLIMKEVANSGHLDAIAVFVTTAAIYLFVRLLNAKSKSEHPKRFGLSLDLQLSAVALLLAAGVGAKIYPVVLTPLLLFVTGRRFGLARVLAPIATFVVATWLLISPMMAPQTSPASTTTPQAIDQETAQAIDQATDPGQGMKTFIKYWEMNDFLFLIVVENLKPSEDFQGIDRVWFSVAPDGPRKVLSDWMVETFSSERFPITANEAPFMLARLLTTALFVLIAIGLAWSVSGSGDAKRFAEAAFLTLAWFWLLSPTQNPWYWLWAMPLLPFVRNPAWLAMSGLLLVHYLRFWLEYHCSQTYLWGTEYQGTLFFDFVVTWLEFGPWFVLLLLTWWWRRGSAAENAFVMKTS